MSEDEGAILPRPRNIQDRFGLHGKRLTFGARIRLLLTAYRLLVHGIRDYADWQENVEFLLEEKYKLSAHGSGIKVISVRYGYFTALQFLLSDQRQRCIRAFADHYIQEIAANPEINPHNISVFAHSNGAYVVGEALKNFDQIKVGTLYFAGSVCRSSRGRCCLRRQFTYCAMYPTRTIPSTHLAGRFLQFSCGLKGCFGGLSEFQRPGLLSSKKKRYRRSMPGVRPSTITRMAGMARRLSRGVMISSPISCSIPRPRKGSAKTPRPRSGGSRPSVIFSSCWCLD